VEAALRTRADELARANTRLSVGRLVTFLGAATSLATGVGQGSKTALSIGTGLLLLFAVLVIRHARLVEQYDRLLTLAEVHAQHRRRIAWHWPQLRMRPDLLAPDHPYAWDLNVVGPGSLLQRVDVTRTTRGESLLAAWLAEPADPSVIEARQRAVAELAGQVELRCVVEAAGLRAQAARAQTRDEKLDPEPFVSLGALPSVFCERPWLVPVVHVFPLFSVSVAALWAAGLASALVFAVPAVVSVALQSLTSRHAQRAFDLVAARGGLGEAFAEMLEAIEGANWESPLLRSLQDHARIDGKAPSVHIRMLARWTGFAELRQHFPLHLPANLFFLWDLQCLLRLERWSHRVGAHVDAWFDSLAIFEALSSLAVLVHQDPDAIFPEIAPPGSALCAEGLVHPLLPPAVRVANDVYLPEPGSALVITGSHMAGKSTLLRAVGLAACLAYAGGPVTARRVRLPLLRMRAVMRAADSLASGTSYFQAELARLQQVIDRADEQPPVLFLMDEPLSGTNASARRIGARAIVLHLLRRGAMGVVATHDVALSALESSGRVRNAHFTDVLMDGEMRFDYRLRPGVVRSSNALRLLARLGIDVPPEELAAEDAARVFEPPTPPSTTRRSGEEDSGCSDAAAAPLPPLSVTGGPHERSP
jgi:ABC-type hemin transport system ATPase subunit